jgi:bifunctional UDP-N-acetylglucosamine pyrophosphorylase/glucosamine-1-phosphate N-acetyltransferase
MDAKTIRNEYEAKNERRLERVYALAAAGVTFEDPQTAYIGEEVLIGEGTYVGPFVTIGGKTQIGKDCFIGQAAYINNSKLADRARVEQGSRVDESTVGKDSRVLLSVAVESEIGEGCSVGPFANLRPGAKIENGAKIGDFVEVKNSVIGEGTKVSHLTYVGDADLGKDINLGCGVVFVNYDGKEKHRTKVGDGAFIGCNSNLVAPVTVEEKAYIAAGTTVTKRVPAGSLSIARPKEQIIEGWTEARGLLKIAEKKGN